MTQMDSQITAFQQQLQFQNLIHGVYNQTNNCIQEVNNYMYQLQMNLFLQQQQQQQNYQFQNQYFPQSQYQYSQPMMPMQWPQYQSMPFQFPEYHQIPATQIPNYQMPINSVPITPVIIQPPTPPPVAAAPHSPKSVPKVVIEEANSVPIVKFRIKPTNTKPKESSTENGGGKLSPSKSTTAAPNSNRNSLIDELKNSGGRKSLRKTSRREQLPKKKESMVVVPAWVKNNREREIGGGKKRSSLTHPGSFESLEALLLGVTKTSKKDNSSMPNLRNISRANSNLDEDKKSIKSNDSIDSNSSSDESLVKIKPKPPTSTNLAIAIKEAQESIIINNQEIIIPVQEKANHEEKNLEVASEAKEAREEDLKISEIPNLSNCRALILHKQLNPEYPETPHGWHLLMWTIRRVGKLLKKHPDPYHQLHHSMINEKKKTDDEEHENWEVIHHRN